MCIVKEENIYCFNTIRLNKRNSFDETTTITKFQINATKMFIQIVIKTKNFKTSTIYVKKDKKFDENIRNLTINILFNKNAIRFRVIY